MSIIQKLNTLFALPAYAPALRCSFKKLAITLCISLVVVIGLETSLLPSRSAFSQDEHTASLLAQEAMRSVRDFRADMGIPIDPIVDPNHTGLIGFEYSDLTTTEGILSAKRTATNPAFAGLIVKLLHQAGVQRGDRVAVSFTGSFPSLNIATLAACQTMGLEPYIISSVGASTFGANIPGLTWLDMEKHLYDTQIFPYRATAISLGGVVETQGGIDGTGLILAQEAISRHGGIFLEEGDYRVVERDVLARKKLFDAHGPIKAFINVGGGLSSLGWVPEAAKLDAGLLRTIPATQDRQRGLLFRFAEEKVPVLHILNIARLAERYALPVDPIPLPLAEQMSTQRFVTRYLLCLLILLVWAAVGLFFLKKGL